MHIGGDGAAVLAAGLIYSDAALTQALANPLSTDGLGNYTFYAAPGRYEIEISGPGITTKQLPNVILPSDPSFADVHDGHYDQRDLRVFIDAGRKPHREWIDGGNGIAHRGRSAGAVDQCRIISGEQPSDSRGPIPWRDITAYMPAGGCDQSAFVVPHTTGTIISGTNALSIRWTRVLKMAAEYLLRSAGAALDAIRRPRRALLRIRM